MKRALPAIFSKVDMLARLVVRSLPTPLVTWGEDGRGDGQDWEIDWGTVEDYPARRLWRGRRQ